MIQKRGTKESARIRDSESRRERRRGVALEEKKVPANAKRMKLPSGWMASMRRETQKYW